MNSWGTVWLTDASALVEACGEIHGCFTNNKSIAIPAVHSQAADNSGGSLCQVPPELNRIACITQSPYRIITLPQESDHSSVNTESQGSYLTSQGTGKLPAMQIGTFLSLKCLPYLPSLSNLVTKYLNMQRSLFITSLIPWQFVKA